MAYQVLARKYRPQRFSDVVGQDHVTRTLGHALEQGRIAHGYIFSGHRGIGKTTIARILAMALNCRRTIGSPERPTYEPCGTCESCEEVRAGNAVDVIEIDAATNRGIDEIRELRDAARYRPARDRYKIYILDEAHQITDAAFNALLKTLEEPPDHVVFMMATTQPEDILQTIRSRCQHFSFHAVKFDAILQQLRTIAIDEQVVAEDEALGLLAEAGDGSMRDALSIMDQAIASAPVEDGKPRLGGAEIRELMGTMPNAVFSRLLESVSENNSAAVLGELDRLLGAGNSASQIARQLVRYLRNVLMARIAGEATELLQLSPDERARAAGSALLFGEEELTRFLQIMLRTFDELNYRQEQRFHLELGVLKLVHLQRLLPVEELLTQLGDASGSGRLPATALPARSAAEPVKTFSAKFAQGAPAKPAAVIKGTDTSTGVPVFGAGAVTSAAAPAFSPFEQDAKRKAISPATRFQSSVLTPVSPVAEALSQAPVALPISPAPLHPPMVSIDGAEASHTATENEVPAGLANAPVLTSAAVKTAVAESRDAEATPEEQEQEQETKGAEAVPIGVSATASSTVSNHAAPSSAPSQAESATAPAATPALQTLDLDAMREAVCAALEAGGHTTAATLLGAGGWTETPDAVRVEVTAKKTMLGLTMNLDAEKIVKAAARPYAGQPPKRVQWIPVEGAATKATARPAPSGSVQALALENPLVQQAKNLFQAEVRSVVDLRGKR